MKNIPLFTTEAGVASLILEQVSFNKTAYVRVQSTLDADNLLQECIAFCRAVGAEQIYAAGDLGDRYGKAVSLIRMRRLRTGIEDNAGLLIPVNADNITKFQEIYNEAMRNIPGASGMNASKASEMLKEGNGYFVYYKEELVGIGVAAGEWIHTVIAQKKGMGQFVMQALNRVLVGDWIRVEVIESNIPAMRLYQRMGFTEYETVSNWKKIFQM